MPWKWLSLCLVAVLAIAGLALLPRILFDSASLQQRLATELSTRTGAEVRLTGPLTVRYLPNVSIRGGLQIKGGAGTPWLRSLKAEEVRVVLDLPDLVRGRISIDDLRIVQPRIALEDRREPAVALEAPQRLLASLLGDTGVRRLIVRGGEIRFRAADKGQRITELEARLRLNGPRGRGSGSGSFVWREEKVRFFAEWGSPAQLANAGQMPLTINLTSKPVTASVGGQLSFEDGSALTGHGNLSAPDLRAFLNWTGMQLSDDSSLRDFNAAGAFTLFNSVLSFDDVALTLDGNEGVGVMAIDFGKLRPRIDGTLDFETLALDPYLASGQTDSENAASSNPWSPFGWRLLRHFDADLRLSSANTRLGSINFGRMALTMALSEGVLSSDISEIDVCGGLGNGNFRVDVATIITRVRLNARITDMALEPCVQHLPTTFVPQGAASVELRLTGEGRGEPELLQSLTGQFKVEARDGSIPIDLASVVQKQVVQGDFWNEQGITAYATLNSTCEIEAGRLRCQDFDMQSSKASVSGYGEVDFSKQALDWLVFVSGDIVAVAAPSLSANHPVTVTIRGPWSQPTIRRTVRAGDSAVDPRKGLARGPNLRQATGSAP
jgi:AsmA protein